MKKYTPIKSAWPENASIKKPPLKLASYSALKGKKEHEFRIESVIEEAKPSKLIQQMREDIARRRTARNRLLRFLNQK